MDKMITQSDVEIFCASLGDRRALEICSELAQANAQFTSGALKVILAATLGERLRDSQSVEANPSMACLRFQTLLKAHDIDLPQHICSAALLIAKGLIGLEQSQERGVL